MDSSYTIPQREYRYRDLTGLTRWLGRALWLDIAVSAVLLIAKIAAAFIKPLATAAGALTGVWFLTFLIAVALTLLWLYLAAANVHNFGADISFEPPGAMGWLLIPILNLWMSFLVFEEIWQASIDARHWREHHVPWPMIHWWIAWVVASIGAVMLYLMSGSAVGNVIATLVYFGGHIAYAYLLIPVVNRINALQQTQALVAAPA